MQASSTVMRVRTSEPDHLSVDPASAALELLAYCRADGWAGYDPYDALNSGLFKTVPALDAWLPRLAATQLLKRSPYNIRRLLRVPKTLNPKGLALFLASLVKLRRLGLFDEPEVIESLLEELVALRSPGAPNFCWGYSFPWQTRTHIVARGVANLVCTTFVGNALLDTYDESRDQRCLEMARSAATHIVEHWYREGKDQQAYFLYPLPDIPQQIHNANFLGAAFLCRVARHTGDGDRFVGPALRTSRYSVSRQHPDGSWPYGELPRQGWIDNFHTGYNLSGLRTVGRYAGTHEFDDAVRRGFAFYRAHFIREDGAARYFHDKTYPIDAHCVAQTLMTLVEFKDLDDGNVALAQRVYEWAMNNMWDDRGFFYYRVHRLMTIRTSYMRWTQAWMLLALTTFLEQAVEEP